MLRERSDKIAKIVAGGSIIDSPTLIAMQSGRYQEINDLLEMTFQELMGE